VIDLRVCVFRKPGELTNNSAQKTRAT